MLVGVPKEIKNHEYRVGLTPASVRELTARGHEVVIETAAGAGIGFTDDDYRKAGASIAETAAAVFDQAEMIVKVKEPQAVERKMLQPHHTLFTYLHLAPDVEQTQDLIASGATCIAYETVTDDAGRLPLLAPMSEVAGRMSIQAGAHSLEKAAGGRGVLLGGVPGVEAGRVLIIGGGVVGQNALAMAVGLGAEVTVLDKNIETLRQLDDQYGGRVRTLVSNQHNLEAELFESDLVVGAVLIPGASAPKLVTKEMISKMKPGSVLVDVAIDQGGCFETSHATTHQEPTFEVDGVIHYCVANMPGGVARTSTLALNNATLPFVLALASKGAKQAMQDDPHLLNGLNVAKGKVTCKEVADSQNLEYVSEQEMLASL
mgnify:FL=1